MIVKNNKYQISTAQKQTYSTVAAQAFVNRHVQMHLKDLVDRHVQVQHKL
jgi:hypothetical protein